MRGCRVLTDEEVSALLDRLGTRDSVLILTGLTFGTRVSESLSLCFGDFKGDFLYVRSKKGSENTSFPIPEPFHQALGELRTHYEARGIGITPATPLFLSRKGKGRPITRQQASQIFKGTCARLGISGKVNTHSLRKSFVTKIYQLTGKDLAQTKVYSRHKSLSNLDHYIETTRETHLVKALRWGKK